MNTTLRKSIMKKIPKLQRVNTAEVPFWEVFKDYTEAAGGDYES